jgi:single-strand DNA-binding protein
MSFNKIIIIGNLGRDPELRYTPQGSAVCNFPVATSERRKNASGEQEEITTWFRVSAWGRQAELANEYLTKGKPVYVEGRLRVEEYTDRDGKPRTSLEVNATDVQFISQRGDEAAQPVGHPVSNAERKPVEAKAAGQAIGAKPNAVEIQDDDIPF